MAARIEEVTVPHRGSVVFVASVGLLLQAAASPRLCAASATLRLKPSIAAPPDATPFGTVRPTPAIARSAAGSPKAMQTAGTADGGIYGTVTDKTGAALPDVTVVISSDALIGDKGKREGMTNAEGAYRFGALPPGNYTLLFAREGFKTVERQGVHVGIGFAARVDIELEIATVREQVTVKPPAPVIDGRSTAVTFAFDPHLLANLPSSRSLVGILSATPAVRIGCLEVGGNKVKTGCFYSAYGAGGRPEPTMEGLNVTGILARGVPLNYGSFQAVSVLTAGHGLQFEAPGVHSQIVVKSGGNQYHGTFYADYWKRGWQSFNIDEDQTRLGIRGDLNRQWSYHDINTDVGGHLKPDRIWWYFSFRNQEDAAWQDSFPVVPVQTDLTSYTAKGTVRLTENQTLIAYGHAGLNHQPHVLTGFHESEESTAEQHQRGWVWKGQWNATIGGRTALELLAGAFGDRNPQTPNGTAPRFEDVATGVVRGAASAGGRIKSANR